ncbi:immunoglobulin A1 protease autotransporter isoform X1 [Oreochromis niloticus]|uniref:immunoglobulin A1 protease autotransporter isoform X1 n=1 Tax=Oreochromis niloticus TaxID=8128 RepID=UPI000393FEBA|nr:immunoglobulin A1 protease autotransporter isoform X1 [Oreochromis niloticus]
MMSYLWILLLGSLLATHAKAQDDIIPTVEPSIETPTSKADVEVIDQHNLEEAVTATEEVLQPEPTADPETELIQEANAADVSTEPVATDAPAGEEGESASPTTGETEAIISEAATTTQAADSEDDAPEATQTAVNEEEQPTTNANTTPAQDKSGLHDIITTVGLETNEEAPTDPSANEESSTDDFTTFADETVTMNPGFNIEKTSIAEQETHGSNQETHVKGRMGPQLNSGGLNQESPVEKRVVTHQELGAPLSKEERKDEDVSALGASGSDDKQSQKASSSSLAAILSAIVVSAVGAIAGYFTYQQKKLCFKNRQEADPEAPHKADAAEARSDPQVLSNLLNSS